MKHIVLVGNTAWSMYNFRAGLIRGLLENGYRVSVVAPADNEFAKRIQEIGAAFIDVQMEAKGTNPIKDLWLFVRLRRIFHAAKPDFVFFYTIKPNIYGSIAAHILGIPHIAITTGLGYTFLNNNIVAKIARRLYKFAFKSPKEVWFLNREDFESFLQYHLISESKGYILKGEGINLERFAKSNNQSNDVTFLLMARMLWDKGVGEYVEAARILKVQYPAVQFKLLGFMGVDNPSAISEHQMSIWQKEGVVEYLGSTSDVVPFVAAASCVVLPSYREGVPITLLEAAAMCKPIVTTDSIGCRDTVDDGKTGYMCHVKDVLSLKTALEKIVLMTPAQRQAMGVAGREKMEAEFDEQLVVKTYIGTLKKYNI
ncbi:MAG: glycosyltransferase family 4 protein [Alistipes sp.]